MKQRIRLKGRLKAYLEAALVLGAVLAGVNIGIYFLDIGAGVIVSAFLVVYFIVMLILLYYNKVPHKKQGFSLQSIKVVNHTINVIPYIGGEEEKSEQEPLKIWGKIEGDKIVKTDDISITSQCIRVPVSDGHTAAVFMSFKDGVKKPTVEEIIDIWSNYSGRAQELDLPSAPKHFLHYFTEPDRPQIKSERNLENGMAVSVGRLRPDTQYDYKFVCMSHNTLRGAAGGAVLLAELLAVKGYFD